MKRRLVRMLAGVAVIYAVACGAIAAFYRPFLYPAPSTSDPPLPPDAKLVQASPTSRAFRFGPDHAPLTIVYFHGNGQLAEDGFGLARDLASHGWAVLLPEYRGYGVSRASGRPSERALYDDAAALVASLVDGSAAGGTSRIPTTDNDRIVLMGYSLGTGVCVELASRGLGRALVLLAPYTSIPDVAARRLPMFPMRSLLGDKLDSESKAARVQIPAFVAHGDRDDIVPFDMGETLAHTFPKGRFVTVSGANHVNMFATDDHLMQKIVDFLLDVAP